MFINAFMAPNSKNAENIASNQNVQPDYEAMLVTVGRDQDKDAFSVLFEYFAPRIKSYLMRGGADERTADELAQETMLTIWKKADSYDPKQAKASTWIYTIARNKRIDHLRKFSKTEMSFEEGYYLEDDAESQADIVTLKQQSDGLAEAIKSLPEEQAALLKKSFYEDKSHSEIAEETNIPLGTVKSRIRMALERLRHENKVKALWN